jgi:hypothetical protein
VSLGTGGFVRRLPNETAKGWTIAHWALNGFELVADGVSDAVDYHAQHFPGVEFFRFQIDVPQGTQHMDDASPRNIGALIDEAERLVRARRTDLERISSVVAQ